MTAKSTTNEDVQTALDKLNEWTCEGTELLHYNGNNMRVKINLRAMGDRGTADLIESLIRHNWNLISLDLWRETAEISGKAHKVE